MIKIQRSPEPPESLAKEKKKKKGSYRKQDVHDKLKENFYNKCYICESNPVMSREVEHLRPHHKAEFGGEYWDRKFDWKNLFLSCRHCNLLKGEQENILDCCEDDPEKVLRQKLMGANVVVESRNSGDASVVATAKLIQESFMAQTPPARKLDAEDRRKLLQEEILHITKTLNQYRRARKSKRKAELLETLRQMVQLDQAYAGFIRTEVRELQWSCPELKKLLEIDEQNVQSCAETEVRV